MQYRFVVACSALIVVPTACGGGGSAAKPAATPVEASAQQAEPAAEQPVLTPVAAPDGLIAVGRVKSPAAILDKFVSWTAAPLDWRQKLEAESPNIARAIALDAPIEAAVSLPSRRRSSDFPAVVSLGLKSVDIALDVARREGFSVSKLGPALYRVEGHDLDYCVIGAALGAAPARLVCGKNAAAVDALGPYALRGLPSETLPDADVHVELRAGPARRMYAGEIRQLKMLVPLALHELKLNNPRFDRAAADALHALADEIPALVNDIDRVSLDAKLTDQTQSLELVGSLTMVDHQSWVAKLLQETGAHATRPPESFWKMPADSASADYATTSMSKSTENVRDTLTELLAGYLETANVAPKSRDDLVHAFAALLSMNGVHATAAGTLPFNPKSKDKPTLAERVRTMAGWRLFVDTNKPDVYRGLLGALANLVEDKGLRKRVADLAHLNPEAFPHVKSRPAAALGAGATEYEISMTSKALEAASIHPTDPVSVYLVVAPLGTGTVVGFAAAKDEVYSRIKALRAGKGPTLADREGLDGLKSVDTIGGGFLTLEQLLGSDTDMHEDVGQLLTSLPHHGRTPMLAWSTIQTSGSASTAGVRFAVPKDVFADVLAAAIGGLFGNK